MAQSVERKVVNNKFTPCRQVSLEGFYEDRTGVECFVTYTDKEKVKTIYRHGTTCYLDEKMFLGYNWKNISSGQPKECHVLCNDETLGVFDQFEHAKLFYDALVRDFYNSAKKPAQIGTLVESHFSLIVNDWGVLINKELWLNFKGEFTVRDKPLKLFQTKKKGS